jgi:hypothetical protein
MAWISTSATDCVSEIMTGLNTVQTPYVAGAMLTPLTVPAAASVPIGRNYLYNMVMTWNYFYESVGGAPACTLPGCSWSTDSIKVNRCIQVGVIKPIDASSTPNAGAPAFSWPTTLSNNYDYDAIGNVSNYVWIGPFSCDDQTLECTAVSPAITSHEQNF